MQQSTKIEKKLKDRKDRAIKDTVLDAKTLNIIRSLQNNRFLRDMSGVLAAGKESNVYTGYTALNLFSKLIFSKRKSKKQKIAANESSEFTRSLDKLLISFLEAVDLTSSENNLFKSFETLNQHQKAELMILLKYKNINLIDLNQQIRYMVPSAIKIYQTSKMEFKKRLKYLVTEERFKSFCHKNPRKLVKVWAEKEVRNMKRLLKKRIPTVVPLYLKRNIFIMSCLKESQCFCMLSNIDLEYKFTNVIQKSITCNCIESAFESKFQISCDEQIQQFKEFKCSDHNEPFSDHSEEIDQIVSSKTKEKNFRFDIYNKYDSAGLFAKSCLDQQHNYFHENMKNFSAGMIDKRCLGTQLSSSLKNLLNVDSESYYPTKIDVSAKQKKTSLHILFNSAPKLKDFKVDDHGIFVDLYFQAIKIIKDMYQKCTLIHSDFSEYNLLVTRNHLDSKAFCANSKFHSGLQERLYERKTLALSKKEIRHMLKQKNIFSTTQENIHITQKNVHKSKTLANESGLEDLYITGIGNNEIHDSDCYLRNREMKTNLPIYSLYVIDLGQAVDVNHIFADEFLIKDINQMNSFFAKRGVDVFFINDLFVEITGKYIPSAFYNNPLTEKVFIPNCLEEIKNPEDLKPFSAHEKISKSKKSLRQIPIESSQCINEKIATNTCRISGSVIENNNVNDFLVENDMNCSLSIEMKNLTMKIAKDLYNDPVREQKASRHQNLLKDLSLDSKKDNSVSVNYDASFSSSKDEFPVNNVDISLKYIREIDKDSRLLNSNIPPKKDTKIIFSKQEQFTEKIGIGTGLPHHKQSRDQSGVEIVDDSTFPNESYDHSTISLNLKTTKNNIEDDPDSVKKALLINERSILKPEEGYLKKSTMVSCDLSGAQTIINENIVELNPRSKIDDSQNEVNNENLKTFSNCESDLTNLSSCKNSIDSKQDLFNKSIKAQRKIIKELKREKRKIKMPKKVKKKAEAAHKKRN